MNQAWKIAAGAAAAGGLGLVVWYFVARAPALPKPLWEVGDVLYCGEPDNKIIVKITERKYEEQWHYHCWEYLPVTDELVEDLGWSSEEELLAFPCVIYVPAEFAAGATLTWD